MTKSKLDNFFDALDSAADKFVGVMEKSHPKDEVEDAEVVATYSDGKVFGSVPGPDGRSVYYHLFPSQHSTSPSCDPLISLPHRSVLHLSATGFLGNVCIACLRALVAPQAQSKQKELPGVR